MNIYVPDRMGKSEDVVLGFDHFDGYIEHANYYLGPIIGRVANRISRGRFCINKKRIELERNDRERNHFNGGTRGFHSFNFTAHTVGTVVRINVDDFNPVTQ